MKSNSNIFAVYSRVPLLIMVLITPIAEIAFATDVRVLGIDGDFQASCPKNYAAFFSRCIQVFAEFSGLSQTSSTRFQFRVLPLQRKGCLRFAS